MKKNCRKASAVNPVYKAIFLPEFCCYYSSRRQFRGLLSNMWNIMIRNEIRSPEKMLRYPCPTWSILRRSRTIMPKQLKHPIICLTAVVQTDRTFHWISAGWSDEQNQQEVSGRYKYK